jgi:predicted aldo/keto reductase-like oxidoreductase
MAQGETDRPDRRAFLQAGALATASALSTTPGYGAQDAPAAAKAAKILPKRKLGKTGLEITMLEMGTGALREQGVLERLIRLSYAAGVRTFDTAKAYGTEPGFKKWFERTPEVRKEIVLVTKDNPRAPKEMLGMLDKRLAALSTDYIDLFFIHGLGDDHSLDDALNFVKSQEFKETADAIRKSGKAKFVGFSCHNKDLAQMLTTAAEANVVDMIMVKYNAFAAKDHPFNKALDAVHAKGIGLISMKQLAGSETLLSDMSKKLPALKEKGLAPYEMLLHAIWTDERISSCCVSLKNVDQITQGVHAARTFEPLKAAELQQIHEIFLAHQPTLCALCDGRCSVAGGTDAALGDLTRYLTYHEHHGDRTEARRLYGELPESARDWKGADLAAAQAACPTHLDFSKLLPKVDEYLA